jgi:hypothetical protein
MNSNLVKLVLGLSLVGMLVIFAGLVAAFVVALYVSSPWQLPATELPSSVELQPGMVLKGSGRDMFYLTPEHTRRRISDMDTFVAFGFSPNDLVRVDETALAAIPLGGELNRLVQFEQGNLYWVMNGQRWLVNEWQPVISRVDYAGGQPTPLDDWLEHNLAVRLNFEQGMLLQSEGGPVYTYDFDAITLVDQAEYVQARIIQVPADVLTVYPRHHAPDAIARYLVTDTHVPVGSGLK